MPWFQKQELFQHETTLFRIGENGIQKFVRFIFSFFHFSVYESYGVKVATDIFVLLPILISSVFAYLHWDRNSDSEDEHEYSDIDADVV